MPELYPLFADLARRPCLVVGAGPVAERKVGSLLAAAARVTLVAPAATPKLVDLAERGEVRWLRRGYEASDFDGMTLAVVATSDPATNRLAVREGRARGVWVNAAEEPSAGDFHVPAVLRTEALSVAVSSAGTSPALAAWVRDRLAEVLPRGLSRAARVLGALREDPPGRPAATAVSHRALLDAGLADDLDRGDWAAADEKISRHYASAPPVAEILGVRSPETT